MSREAVQNFVSRGVENRAPVIAVMGVASSSPRTATRMTSESSPRAAHEVEGRLSQGQCLPNDALDESNAGM